MALFHGASRQFEDAFEELFRQSPMPKLQSFSPRSKTVGFAPPGGIKAILDNMKRKNSSLSSELNSSTCTISTWDAETDGQTLAVYQSPDRQEPERLMDKLVICTELTDAHALSQSDEEILQMADKLADQSHSSEESTFDSDPCIEATVTQTGVPVREVCAEDNEIVSKTKALADKAHKAGLCEDADQTGTATRLTDKINSDQTGTATRLTDKTNSDQTGTATRLTDKTNSDQTGTRLTDKTNSDQTGTRLTDKTNSDQTGTRLTDKTNSDQTGTRLTDKTNSDQTGTRLTDKTNSDQTGTRLTDKTNSDQTGTRLTDKTNSDQTGTRLTDKTNSDQTGTRTRLTYKTNSDQTRTRLTDKTHSDQTGTRLTDKTNSGHTGMKTRLTDKTNSGHTGMKTRLTDSASQQTKASCRKANGRKASNSQQTSLQSEDRVDHPLKQRVAETSHNYPADETLPMKKSGNTQEAASCADKVEADIICRHQKEPDVCDNGFFKHSLAGMGTSSELHLDADVIPCARQTSERSRPVTRARKKCDLTVAECVRHECIIRLTSWSLQPVGRQNAVRVEGKPPNSDYFWLSSVIVERVSSRILKSINGSLYQLQGNISVTTTLAAGFPKELTQAFRRGFPQDWRELIAPVIGNAEIYSSPMQCGSSSKDNKGDCTSLHTPKQVDDDPISSTAIWTPHGVMSRALRAKDVCRTQSGRAVIPPLARWAGQYVKRDVDGNVTIGFTSQAAERHFAHIAEHQMLLNIGKRTDPAINRLNYKVVSDIHSVDAQHTDQTMVNNTRSADSKHANQVMVNNTCSADSKHANQVMVNNTGSADSKHADQAMVNNTSSADSKHTDQVIVNNTGSADSKHADQAMVNNTGSADSKHADQHTVPVCRRRRRKSVHSDKTQKTSKSSGNGLKNSFLSSDVAIDNLENEVLALIDRSKETRLKAVVKQVTCYSQLSPKADRKREMSRSFKYNSNDNIDVTGDHQESVDSNRTRRNHQAGFDKGVTEARQAAVKKRLQLLSVNNEGKCASYVKQTRRLRKRKKKSDDEDSENKTENHEATASRRWKLRSHYKLCNFAEDISTENSRESGRKVAENISDNKYNCKIKHKRDKKDTLTDVPHLKSSDAGSGREKDNLPNGKLVLSSHAQCQQHFDHLAVHSSDSHSAQRNGLDGDENVWRSGQHYRKGSEVKMRESCTADSYESHSVLKKPKPCQTSDIYESHSVLKKPKPHQTADSYESHSVLKKPKPCQTSDSYESHSVLKKSKPCQTSDSYESYSSVKKPKPCQTSDIYESYSVLKKPKPCQTSDIYESHSVLKKPKRCQTSDIYESHSVLKKPKHCQTSDSHEDRKRREYKREESGKKYTLTQEEPILLATWNKEEIEKLHGAVEQISSDECRFWELVSKCVGSRSSKECATFYLQDKTRNTGRVKHKEAKQEEVTSELKGKSGTLKRCRELKIFLHQLNINKDPDDLFQGTPFRTRKKPKVSCVDFGKTDEEVFGRNPNFFTPKHDGLLELGCTNSYTPVSNRKTPSINTVHSPWHDQVTVLRHTDDYIFQLKKKKKQLIKICNKKKKKAVSASHPTVQLFASSPPAAELLRTSHTEDVEQDEEEDYYYSDTSQH